MPSGENILVGRVLRPHGVRGEVKVEVHSDVPDRFAAGRILHVVPGRGRAFDAEVLASRPHQGALLVRFAGVDDRDAAESLRDARIEIGEDDVPSPAEGVYYHYQLVGCLCVDRREGEIGTVVDVVEDGGGDLLVVEKKVNGVRERIPVPFADAFLGEIDVEGRRIELDLPPGLIETCISRS